MLYKLLKYEFWFPLICNSHNIQYHINDVSVAFGRGETHHRLSSDETTQQSLRECLLGFPEIRTHRLPDMQVTLTAAVFCFAVSENTALGRLGPPTATRIGGGLHQLGVERGVSEEAFS